MPSRSGGGRTLDSNHERSARLRHRPGRPIPGHHTAVWRATPVAPRTSGDVHRNRPRGRCGRPGVSPTVNGVDEARSLPLTQRLTRQHWIAIDIAAAGTLAALSIL